MREEQVFFRSANRLLLGHFVTRAECMIRPARTTAPRYRRNNRSRQEPVSDCSRDRGTTRRGAHAIGAHVAERRRVQKSAQSPQSKRGHLCSQKGCSTRRETFPILFVDNSVVATRWRSGPKVGAAQNERQTKNTLQQSLNWSGQQDLNLRPSGPKPDFQRAVQLEC